MLVELDLRPGLRVLEIGTGSGYHAALMAGLVGDPRLVTTVDIDDTLITETVSRLEQLGYGTMTVLCADGAHGVAERAPFDRIVATVGCADLSPAWIEQLTPDGQMLVPLEHGALHPRVEVRRDETRRDQELVGRFVGHSGFVRIQGLQSTTRLWNAKAVDPESGTLEPLPSALLSALFPPEPTHRQRTPGIWDLATYLAIRDRRCAVGPALAEHDSVAVLRNDRLLVTGRDGPALKDRLLEIAADWLELGAPGLGRYTMSFSRRSGTKDDCPADSPAGPWHLDRLHHRQTIALLRRSS
jgi:protein-L-isoaspartate(D-aspartate) O-methyltransferase